MAGKGKVANVAIDITANTAGLVKGMQDATSSIKKLQSDVSSVTSKIDSAVKGIGAGFGALIPLAAIGAAVAGVTKLIGVMNELANKGDVAGDIADSFERLGGASSSIDQARDRVLGMADSYDLMQRANELMLKQVPQVNEQFGNLAEYAGKLAQATGGDLLPTLDELTGALATVKDKQLAALGIFVDAKKANEDYAASVGKTVDQLTSAEEKYAKQLAVYEEIGAASEHLTDITDSSANAWDALQASLEQARKEVGMGINASEGLTEAYRSLQDVVESVDWKSVGDGIGVVAEAMAKLIQFTISAAQEIGELSKVAKGFYDGIYKAGEATGEFIDKVRGDTYTPSPGFSLGPADPNAEKLMEARKALQEAKALIEKGAKDGTGINIRALEEGLKFSNSEVLTKEIDGVIRKYKELEGVIKPIKPRLSIGANDDEESEKKTDKAAKAAKSAQDKIAKDAESAAKRAADLRERFFEDELRRNEDNLRDQLDAAITSLNTTDFRTLQTKLADATKQGFLDGQKDALSLGGDVAQQIQKRAQEEADAVVSETDDAWREAVREREQVEKESIQNNADFWEQAFTDAVGIFGDSLDSNLSSIIVKLGTQIATELTKGVEGLKTPQEAQSDALKEMFGLGKSQEQYGPLTEEQTKAKGISDSLNSAVSGFQAFATTYEAYRNAKDVDKATGTNKGTGGAVGAGAGAAIGAYFGGAQGAQIGAQVGKPVGEFVGGLFGRGSQNPETQARHAFANWIEDELKKLSVYGSYGLDERTGKQRLFLNNTDSFNFYENHPRWATGGGNDRFKQPGFVEEFYAPGNMRSDAANVFKGLGESLRRLQGTAEDVGSHIGIMLAENLGGSIDGARLLVQELGLSLEDLEAQLVDAGRKGEMTWLDVESALQGVNNAFGEGLEAVGDVQGAFQQLADSGGRGIPALKAVRDLAVEAMEQGAKSLDDFKKKLLENGVAPEDVNAIIEAFKQRGIANLEDVKDASDRVVGGIVADIEARSKTMSDSWAQVTQNITTMNDELAKIPKEVESNIRFNIQSNIDDQTRDALAVLNKGGSATINLPQSTNGPQKAFAFGGIINSRTSFGNYLMGEEGSEAVLPLRRLSNGDLGVGTVPSGRGKSLNISIDARGASHGIETRLRRDMQALGTYLVRNMGEFE